jgi:hypothetical protein
MRPLQKSCTRTPTESTRIIRSGRAEDVVAEGRQLAHPPRGEVETEARERELVRHRPYLQI